MILELFPEAKKVGLLYCSAEPNSEYQVKVVEDYLTDHKAYLHSLLFLRIPTTYRAVTTKAAADSDVIYIPTDNTAASCTETIGNIVRSNKTPVSRRRSGHLLAAAASPPSPSATTTLATKPVKWPPKF